MPTSATPSFSDSFTSLSLHQTWQSGDKWSLIAPDTPSGRGGPIYNENGDQWWTNPYNTNTPISGSLYAGGRRRVAAWLAAYASSRSGLYQQPRLARRCLMSARC